MELRSSGFVGSNSVNHYITIPVLNKSKEELYKRTLSYVTHLKKDPQSVVSTIEGKSITIKASTNAIKGKLPNVTYSTLYKITLYFNEGEIKFEPLIVELKECLRGRNFEEIVPFFISNRDSSNPYEIKAVWMVKENGASVLNEELKTSLEQWVNQYISSVMASALDNR